ncbi:ABC transporter substrate-binding protein [Actinomadura rugatobispora]|uniref:ABC transporter substrate-binding protein n=1 Tax=Actinomadura rugatobispora TaxID=1994 RepID=A0ABW1ADW0_9ACTN|nr:ABC transporter substrate-binding protein [Actinomadura rugatobispora]
MKDGKVVLGEVTDLSGVASSYGIPESQGAQIAVDQINAAGGIKSLNGAKLEIKKYDTASSTDNGTTKATAAVGDKVAAVFGGEISDTVLAGINVTHRAGTAWLVSGGTADQIHQRGYDTVFQVAKNSTQFSQGWVDTAKLAAGQLGIANPTVAIAYSQTSYGQDFLNAFETINKTAGFRVVSKIGYPISTTDFSSVAARLASTPADIIFNIGYPADGLNLAKLFATKYSARAKIFMAGGADAGDVVSQLKTQADGTLVLGDVTPSTPGAPPAFKTFYDQYRAKYKAAPNSQALFGYVSVQFAAAAFEKAKSATPSEVAKVLKSVTLTHTTGNIFPSPSTLSFAGNGSLKQAPFLASQVVDGAAKVVFPAAAAESKIQPYK